MVTSRPEAIDAWTPLPNGTRGAQPRYADIAIATALSLRLLLHLPRRQPEGFLCSLLTLMDWALPCPDHTTVSRRNGTLDSRRRIDRAPEGPLALIGDSTGVQVGGQGEWHRQKHGEKKGRRWQKRPIGVDDQGQIIASSFPESHEQDPSHVSALLTQIDREIERCVGAGIYDQAPISTAVADHAPGVQVIIPPRKDAVVSPTATTTPTQRDQHLFESERVGRLPWQRTSGYYEQSRAENAFARCKQIFGGRLRAKRAESQERETLLACQ
jgi:hypothetical protein